MKKIFLLIKIYLLQNYKPDKTKKKGSLVSMICGMSIGFLPLIVLFGIASSTIGSFAATYQIVREVLSILLFMSQIGVFFFGIVGLMSNLYLAKDSTLTSALPVSATTVFLSRLIYVFLKQIIASLIFVFAMLLPFGIGAGVAWTYYPQLLIVLIVLPMLPLLLAALIGIPLMWIVSFFKSKGTFTTIVLAVMFTAAMVLYYLIIGRIEQSGADQSSLETILAQFVEQFRNLGKSLLPEYLLAGSLVPTSAGAYFGNLAACLAINALLLAITAFIAKLVYFRSVSSQQETHKSSFKSTDNYTKKGKLKSLIFSDIKRIIREPSVGISCLMGTIISVVVCMFLSFQSQTKDIEKALDVENARLIAQLAYSVILMSFCAFINISTNVTACSSFTREATKGVSILRMLPIDAEVVYRAKVWAGCIFGTVSTIISCILFGIIFSLDFFIVVCTAIVMFLFTVANVFLQVGLDMRKPRLNWTTFNEGAKNNSSSIWSLLIGLCNFILCALVGVGGIVLCFVGFDFAPYLIYIVLITIGVIYVLVVRKIITSKIKLYFSRLEG